MKPVLITLSLSMAFAFIIPSCKKSSTPSSAISPIAGFWTYKEDVNNDYWNENVLFNTDGTFRMYAALSLADTAAALAIADTSGQVVTFGTYTVSGTSVKMKWQEFSTINLSFSGTLYNKDNIIGNIETSVSGSASPLWYLTKP